MKDHANITTEITLREAHKILKDLSHIQDSPREKGMIFLEGHAKAPKSLVMAGKESGVRNYGHVPLLRVMGVGTVACKVMNVLGQRGKEEGVKQEVIMRLAA